MATITQITSANFSAGDNSGITTDLITNKSGNLTVQGTFSCTEADGKPVFYWSLDGGLTRTAVPAGSVTYISGTTGSFSFTGSFSQGDGGLSFWLEPADGVGDESVGIFEYSITGTSAGATTINSVSDNVDGGVVGVVSSGGLSNDPTLTLAGNAAAGSTVVVKNGGTTIGTVTADLNGAWTLTTGSLSNGTYAFVATATDLSGNSSSSDSYSVTVDATPPATPSGLTLRSSSDPSSSQITGAVTSQSSFFLHGSAEANSTVTVFNGGTELGIATAGSGGAWVFELKDLENGNAYNFRASSSDLAGNSSPISDAIAISVITSPSDAPQIINVSDGVTAGAYTDTGSIANGGVSNDTTLGLTGVAAAGIQVNIYDGSTKLDSVTSNGITGAWSWTTGVLGSGPHSFSVTTTTASGVESAASDPWDVVIDTAAPETPGTFTVTDNVGLRTGSLAVIGNVTDDNSLTLSGTVEAGAKVYIYDYRSPTEIGIVEADESTGDWVFQTGVLADGEYSFTVMASDKAGNESLISDPFNLIVDTTTLDAPVIESVKNGDASLISGTFSQANSVVLSGTADPYTTVLIYNGAELLGPAWADFDGKWTYLAEDLADGSTYVWTAKAENKAGTLSAASNVFTLTTDNTAPILTTTTELLSNANGPLLKENSGTGQVIYTATAADIDGNGVKWSLTGADAASFAVSTLGVITLKDNPNYDTFNADGTSGATAKPSYNFTLVGIDSAGNRSEKALTLGIQNVDEVKPTFVDATVSVLTLNAGSGANQQVYDANFTDTDGTGVLIYTLGGANADRFSIEPNTGKVYLIENPTPSADEVLKYTVTATDATGNNTTTSELSLTIKYVDITAPDAPVISGVFNAPGTTDLGVVLNGTETSGSVVVKGTAEAGSTVTVNWGSNPIKTVVAGTGGAWSMTFLSTEIPSDAANAPITATATDVAGNKSGIQTFNVAIDRVIAQPSLSPVSPDGIINAAEAQNLVLSGTSEVGSSITLIWNGITYTNGSGANDIQLDADGVWTLAVPVANVPAGSGTSNLTLSAVDAAGNVSTALIQAIAYDRVAPTVTVTDNVAGTANRSTAGVAYTYTFSEAVTGLTADDFLVDNGSVSSVSGSGSTYTVTVAPAMDVVSGVISMTLNANAVQDVAGNGNALDVNALQAIDTVNPLGLTLNPIATDNVVNAAEKTAGFTIGGAVEAGTTVSVLWGNQTRAATVTGSTWNLIYASNQIPADGIQPITVTATDAAGNRFVVSEIIRVDTVAPTATVNSLSFSADSGTSTTDFITNTAAQTISGVLSTATAPGDVVEVSIDNGTSWATADNTSGSTAFSLAGVTLPGSNTLQVRVKDSAGNTGAVRSQAYVLDTAADGKIVSSAGIRLSADSGFSTTDLLTNVASQTFSGTLNGNVLAGERVQFSLNDGASWGTATTITNRATFTFTGALAQGANAVKVRHLDVAGNASAEYRTTVTLDNTVATVRGVTIPSATSGSTYKVGDVVDVTVEFSEAVRVTGTPRLGLLVGTNTRQAAYLSGTNSNTLTFRYTIAAGDSDLDGISINAGSLNLNAGTIADAAGNNANIANPAVAANTSSKVDGSLPTLSSTEVVNGNVVMTFSEDLASTSLTPSFFTLSAGGAVTAASVSGKTVTLTPTTAISATAAAGVTVSYSDGSATDLTTGSIQDQAGNDAAAFTNAAATKITATGPISLANTTTFTTAQLGGTNGDAITGNASANTLIGNSGSNRITGGGGADTLTGGLGADTFVYGANSDSLRASFDRITDFVIGTDSIDAARASGALGASKGVVTALTAAGISAVLNNTRFSAATNAAWFTFGSGASQRTFLALNDGTRGFSASTDAIIEMTGFSGNMANLTVI